MTRIRANCPDCGDVELTPSQLLVQVAHDAEELVAVGSRYRFACPECGEVVQKPADERIVQLLMTGGVELEIVGSTLTDALGSQPIGSVGTGHHGPALTHDDLLDLHLLLARDDWFDQLRSSLR